MIATITLNPSLDEHITVNGLVVEEANRWVRLRSYPGGKGIDVSRAIHEMNGISIAYGFIGGPNGRVVEILLDEEGVRYDFTPVRQETRTNFIINDAKNRQQTRIDAPGPRISGRELERFSKKLRQIRPSPDMMTIGGSIPPGIPVDIYGEIIRQARESGIRTILDASGQPMVLGVQARPYLIKPNVYEAEELIGRQLSTEEEIIEAALELVASGIEVVVISRGKEGIIAVTGKTIVRAVPPTVKVRSAVGAGDCTIAGLALKLAYGESLFDACQLAVAMGTAAVLTRGTELCRHEDVDKILPQVKVEEIPVKQHMKAVSSASK
jgi:6-phosphofructokinase 2